MALKDIAEEYFSKLNSIAERLSDDIKETKGTYDKLWLSLSEKEKEQILNESIIKPEVLLRYNINIKDQSDAKEYAVKLVVDDHCSYQDEHSAPFSFRTRSQRDLTMFESEKLVPVKATKQIINKVEPKILKPMEVPTNNISTIPRTGLDLLDNW